MRTLTLFAVSILSFVSVAFAEEEESSLSFDISAGVFSDYMFRGFNLFEGTSVQPSATLSWDTGYGTLSGNIWMHLSAESDRQEERFTELDNTFSYSKEFGALTATVGHIIYSFPGDNRGNKDTREIYASLAADVILSPSLSIYHDYEEFDAQYYELGLAHEFSDLVAEGVGPRPFAIFAFGSNAEKVYEDDGLEHVTFGTSMSIPVGRLTITPTLNYTAAVDDALDNEFWFGTSFGASF